MARVVLAALTVPAPILVHFGFEIESNDFISRHPAECFLPSDLFADSAPALRSLRLMHFQPLWPTNGDSIYASNMPKWARQITHLDLGYSEIYPPIFFHEAFPYVQELKIYCADAVSAVYPMPGRHAPALRRVVLWGRVERPWTETISPVLPGAARISVNHATIFTVQRLTHELVAPPTAPVIAVGPPNLKYSIIEADGVLGYQEEFTIRISDHERGRTREFTEDLGLWSRNAPFHHSLPTMLPEPLEPWECAPNELLSRFEVINRLVALETSLYLLTKLAQHFPEELPVLKQVTLILTVERSRRDIPLDRKELQLKMAPITCPLLEVVTIKDAQTYVRPWRVPLDDLRLLVDTIFYGSFQLRASNVEIY